jgi:hypothetical protein
MSRRKVEKIDFCDDSDAPDSGVEMITAVDFDAPPEQLPLWYAQMKELSASKRAELTQRVLARIKKAKPEAYAFIKSMRCPLVGFMPSVQYTLAAPDARGADLEVDWIHALGSTTLLFWCKQGGFGFFINENLDYDDTVLNKTRGNSKQRLRGFTG